MSLPRIIFVNRVYRPAESATAQLLTDLAEGLAARGWPVHVIAAGIAARPADPEDDPAASGGTPPATRGGAPDVIEHRTGTPAEHGGLFSRFINHRRFETEAARLLASLAQAGDIVVPMTDPPLLAVRLAPVVAARGASLVPWIQDIYPEIAAAHFGLGLGALLAPWRRRRDRSWQTAVRCVTLGETMAATVIAAGVPRERTAIVPNWAPRELDTTASAGAIAAVRARWQLTHAFVVGYSGNAGRVHEFETVLAAADQLRNNDRIVFLFTASGPRLDAIRNTALDRELRNVRCAPPAPRAELAASLAGADVHLVTLRTGFDRWVFPSKIAGILAAGRPTVFVGPRRGEIGRLLASGPAGETIAIGNATGLAQRLEALQADPPRRESLGRHARALYERHFTADAALDRWEAILRSVAADGRAPR